MEHYGNISDHRPIKLTISQEVLDIPCIREKEMLLDKKFLRKTSMELVANLVNAADI